MTIYRLGEHVPSRPSGFHWIAESASVIGDVTIGDDVSIWFGAVLRGDNSTITIGVGTNIQDNAVVHADAGFPAMIGEHCTIGHSAIVHGCIVGPGSLIGMGAIVLNGARIGVGCLLGAGALVKEGQEIPDGCLAVGQPARVVRTLDASETEGLRQSASSYVARARSYAGHLTAL